MNSRTFSSPSATIFSGVSAAANSAGVALLTPASVAWADSTTATSRVNGLTYCSSPRGSALAAAKRRNASVTSSGVQGLMAPLALVLPAGFALAFAATLAAGRTATLSPVPLAALRLDGLAPDSGFGLGFGALARDGVRGVTFLAMTAYIQQA